MGSPGRVQARAHSPFDADALRLLLDAAPLDRPLTADATEEYLRYYGLAALE